MVVLNFEISAILLLKIAQMEISTSCISGLNKHILVISSVLTLCKLALSAATIKCIKM